MKYLIGAIIGCAIAFLYNSVVQTTPTITKRDLAIVINIINDTEIPFVISYVKTDDDRTFSCTLKYKKCSVVIINTGDIGYSVIANDESGLMYSTKGPNLLYAEPRATQTIELSLLSENT
jgi:hypothetical protein